MPAVIVAVAAAATSIGVGSALTEALGATLAGIAGSLAGIAVSFEGTAVVGKPQIRKLP